ncbi:MAG: right-handed parallel beta-helix repeat-containing protein, partial [Halobacteriota archaeon]
MYAPDETKSHRGLRTQFQAVIFSFLLLTSVLATSTAGIAVAQSGEGTCVAAGESIQAALDAAAPGETVCVETGTYAEQLTVTVDDLTIRAAQGHEPVLDGSGSLATGVTVDSAANVTLDGFEIREYDTAIRVTDSSNATVESNTIVDNDWALRDGDTASHGLLVANNTVTGNAIRGLYIQGSDDVRITGNHIAGNGDSTSGSGYGIYVRGGNGGESVTVEENTILNHDVGVSIWTPEGVVRNNTIDGHDVVGVELRTGLGSQDADDALVENNSLDNEGTGIRASSVYRTTIHDNNISGVGDDISLESVRNAVVTDNELTTGIRLDSDSGTADTFDHTMTGNTLYGDPVEYVSGEDNPSFPTNAAQVIVFNSTNVVANGFDFDGVAAGIQIAHSPGVTVSGNTVTNTTGAGIALWGSNDAVVDANTLTRNVLGPSTTHSAIDVEGSERVTVSNNDVTTSDGRAILVEDSTDADVRSNALSANRDGIAVFGSSGATLTENTVTGTHHGGSGDPLDGAIHVSNSENVVLEDNNVSDNSGSGIYDNRAQSSGYATMRGNLVSGNGGDGIYWGDSSDATFVNNTVSDNDRRGIFGPSGATATDNTVTNNLATGIDVSHDSLVANNTVSGNGNHGVEANARATVRENTIADNSGAGIFLRYFSEQTVENNDVSGHDADLVIYETEAVTVSNNTFETGVQLVASSNPYSTLEADLTTHSFSDNTVAGEELYYASGVNAPSVPTDPGQVIVVNATNVDVSNLTFDGVTAPIQVAFSSGTIANNTVTNSTGSSVPRGTLTLWASDDAVVADNDLTDGADDGLRVVESERVELRRNTVANADEVGIRLEGARNATIADGAVTGSGSFGIEAEGSTNLSVDGVTVQHSGDDGLNLGAEGAVVRNSTIADNDGRGIFLTTSGDASLENNTVSTNGEGGIESDFGSYTSDGTTVTGNLVTDNTGTGVDFGASGIEGIVVTANTVRSNALGVRVTNDAVVSENEVTDNLGAGIEVAYDPVGIELSFNDIETNGVGVDYDRGSWSGYEAVNATNNWWGDASGPSGGVTDPVAGTVADGTGDAVTENVRFDPWTGTSVDVTSATLDRSDVSVGVTVTVTATVENTGDH